MSNQKINGNLEVTGTLTKPMQVGESRTFVKSAGSTTHQIFIRICEENENFNDYIYDINLSLSGFSTNTQSQLYLGYADNSKTAIAHNSRRCSLNITTTPTSGSVEPFGYITNDSEFTVMNSGNVPTLGNLRSLFSNSGVVHWLFNGGGTEAHSCGQTQIRSYMTTADIKYIVIETSSSNIKFNGINNNITITKTKIS